MAPKVSICIPAYNQPDLLQICLNSIEKQTFQDTEIIITDDSSDNQIESLIGSSILKNKIRYYRNQPALGSPKNWNHAIEMASGELCKIMHHDDFFTSENSLQEFVDFFEKNPETEFVFCATEIKHLKEEKTFYHQINQKQFQYLKANPEILFYNNLIGSPSVVLFKKAKYIPFNENLKWLVDVDWYVQFINKYISIDYISKSLIGTHHGFEGQTTQEVQKQKTIQIKEHVLMFQTIFDNIKNRRMFDWCFEILFNKYQIQHWKDLILIIQPEAKFENYFKERINKSNNFIFIKKIIFWFKKSGFKAVLGYLKSKLK
jgi:glycosyltransferase involved in cell wall biosynthesis